VITHDAEQCHKQKTTVSVKFMIIWDRTPYCLADKS